ncbi:MAG: hypothetical protein AB9M60_11870 [Leptothrix sp. (in: b-proteobacteria)]
MAEACSVHIAIAADHPAFAGHFPGRPLLPGVVLLAEALEVLLATPAGADWTAATLNAVKFLAPVEPGADLELRWRWPASGARLGFEVWRHAPGDAPAGVLAASGQLIGLSAAP